MAGPEVDPDRLAELRRKQSHEALRKANVRRRQKKELRLALKEGEVGFFDLLTGNVDPVIEEAVSQIRLSKLLPMIPGIGASRAIEVIVAAGVNPGDRLGKLEAEKRLELALIVKGARDTYNVT